MNKHLKTGCDDDIFRLHWHFDKFVARGRVFSVIGRLWGNPHDFPYAPCPQANSHVVDCDCECSPYEEWMWDMEAVPPGDLITATECEEGV